MIIVWPMRVSQQDDVCADLSSDKIMTTFASHASEILKVLLRMQSLLHTLRGDATFSLCDLSCEK